MDRNRSKRPWRQPSPCCDAKRLRNAVWDAYYCSACRTWLERACSCAPEENCPYSEHELGPRPEKAP